MIQDTIKQRLRASLLVTTSRKTIVDAAAHLAQEITEEGTWADLDSEGNPRADTPRRSGQLERTLLIAKARHLAPGEFDDPARRALDWWLGHDLRGSSPRRDQVVVPKLIGEIALLCEDDLSLGAWGKVLEILARSRWAEWKGKDGWVEWSGDFLLGVAYVYLLRGCLEKSASLCETALRRAFRNVRWPQIFRTPVAAGAGQPATGVALAQDYARLIALAYGTPWQAPTDSVKSFVAYLLDFQQWTMRQGAPAADGSDAGMSVPRFDPRALADSVLQLAQLGNPPRRSELVALAERLVGQGKPLSGHRYFWRARFAVHQRPSFYASLRLSADEAAHRDVAPDGTPAVAGTIYFLRTGQEYAAMSGRWKECLLPGVTAIQSEMPRNFTGGHPPVARRMAGGVSDGDCGLSALELRDGGLQGKKSWFFFDDVVACLDAGLLGPSVNEPVCTALNQCGLRGAVVAENNLRQRHTLAAGSVHDLTAARWVDHDGLRYHFPGSLHVMANLDTTSAGHQDVGRGGVFTLWIDHGLKPSGASSVYLVSPSDDGAASHDAAVVEILANTATVQAVKHRGSGTLGITFWEVGVVTLPGGGRVAANRPCLLLCRDDPAGSVSLNVANLTTQPATVHVEYGGRCFAFDLPGGEESGRSVNRQL